MATVKQVQLCPKCNSELPSEFTGASCPNCLAIIAAGANKLFDSPLYIRMQREDLEKKVDQRLPEAELTARMNDIDVWYTRWFRECLDEDRQAILIEAHEILANLLNSTASVEAMRSLTAIGKRIGALSQTIENYARDGGKFYGAKISSTTTSPTGDENIEPTR